MDKDTVVFTAIKLIRSGIYIFIDTFFTVYFFKLCDFAILPISIYYLISYLALTLGFWLVRKAIKRNIKTPYFRIGLSLTAAYLALILLLKENIPQYIAIIALVKGLGEGMYHFPTNVMDSEKISNKYRIKYQGIVNIINVLIGILMPLFIGFALTYYSYVNVGKIFMVFIIVTFILSFWVKDIKYNNKQFNFNKFKKIIKKYPYLKKVFFIRFLSGFTFASGALNVVISLYSILYFKTNMNIGILNSSLAILSLITLSLYTYYLKPKKYNKVLKISFGIILLTFTLLIFYPSIISLICYLLLSNTAILFTNLVLSATILNITNNIDEIKDTFKAEYHLTLEIVLNIGRGLSYLVFLFLGIFGSKEDLNILIVISLVSLIIFFSYFKKLRKEMVFSGK